MIPIGTKVEVMGVELLAEKNAECHHCHEIGHYARNCPLKKRGIKKEKKAERRVRKTRVVESYVLYEDVEEPVEVLAASARPQVARLRGALDPGCQKTVMGEQAVPAGLTRLEVLSGGPRWTHRWRPTSFPLARCPW